MAQAAATANKTAPAPASRHAVWIWKGKTRQGEVRSGEMEAADR